MAAAAMVIAGATIGWRLSYLRSPLAVRDKAIRALHAGDAAALCGLAGRGELARLNITPEGVRGVLRASLWRTGFPTGVRRLAPFGRPTEDVSQWQVRLSGVPVRRPLYVTLYLQRDGSWKLALSNLLRSACAAATGSAEEGEELYCRAAAAGGITGVFSLFDRRYFPL